MEQLEHRPWLKAGVKINPAIRILAMFLSAIFLLVLSHQMYSLVFEPRTIASFLLRFLSLAISSYLLWPFFYAAIKGKSPKLWHHGK